MASAPRVSPRSADATQPPSVGGHATYTIRPTMMMTTSTYNVLSQRGQREQVGSPQMVRVVGQEGAPRLARCARWSSPTIASNRPIADDDAQLEQLTSDALGAPQPVLAGHGDDQVPHVSAEMRPAAARAGLPAPEETPALSTPAHDRVRCHKRQVLAPAGTEPTSQDPHSCPRCRSSTRGHVGRFKTASWCATAGSRADRLCAANRDMASTLAKEVDYFLSIADPARAMCSRPTVPCAHTSPSRLQAVLLVLPPQSAEGGVEPRRCDRQWCSSSSRRVQHRCAPCRVAISCSFSRHEQL